MTGTAYPRPALPNIFASEEDYQIVLAKALHLKWRIKNRTEEGNIYVRQGSELHDNIGTYEAELRAKAPALTERQVGFDLDLRYVRIRHCGEKAVEAYDEAEKARNEYNGDKEKFDAAVKRSLEIVQWERAEEIRKVAGEMFCTGCKKRMCEAEENDESTTPSTPEPKKARNVPSSASVNGAVSSETRSTEQNDDCSSDSVIPRSSPYAENINQYTDHSSDSVFDKSPERKKRKQPWAAANLAKARATRALKKRQRELRARASQEGRERAVLSRSSYSSAEEEIAVRNIGMRAELVFETGDEERLLLTVKGLGRWYETPKGKDMLAKKI